MRKDCSYSMANIGSNTKCQIDKLYVLLLREPNGEIYTGSFGEFGYWSYQNKHLTYSSLVKLIPKTIIRLTNEIWKIYVVGKKVIFQSFSAIYIYENKRISVVKASHAFFILTPSWEQLFAEVSRKGLFELKDKDLVPLVGSEYIRQYRDTIYPTL